VDLYFPKKLQNYIIDSKSNSLAYQIIDNSNYIPGTVKSFIYSEDLVDINHITVIAGNFEILYNFDIVE